MLPQLAASDPHALSLIFDLLDDDARRAAAAVSRGWRDTVRGDPRLWPATVLRGRQAVIRSKEWLLEDRALSGGTAADDAASAVVSWETDVRARVLSRAASISARTERIRLEGFDDQPDLVSGVLAALPAGLTSLELDTPCAGPVLGIIGERFSCLQRLTLACDDGDAINWGAHGTAAAVPLLERLELNYSTPDFRCDDGYLDKTFAVGGMEDGVADLLKSASRLEQLSLSLNYSPAVGQLWVSLPALRHLRLVLFVTCSDEGVAATELAEVVQALQAATQLQSLHLSVTTSTYAEGGADPDDDHWQAELGEPAQLPPLAGLPCLHALDVGGLAVLPADWRELSMLRQLSVRPIRTDEPQAEISFDQPVTALTALTQLRLPAAQLKPALCELEGLRELTIKAGAAPLPAEATRLTSLTSLELHDDSEEDQEPQAPPRQLLQTVRAILIKCEPHRQDAWQAMLRKAAAGTQLRISFLS